MVPCEIWGQLSSSLTLASSRSPFSLPSRLISLDNMSRSEESYRHWKSVSWGPLAFLGHRWHHKILRALRDTVEFPEKGLTMSSGMGFLSPCNYFSLNWLSASWGLLSRSLSRDTEEAIQYLLFPKPEISLSLLHENLFTTPSTHGELVERTLFSWMDLLLLNGYSYSVIWKIRPGWYGGWGLSPLKWTST